jgi:hypothetical protein
MAQGQQSIQSGRWLRAALVFGAGGALATYLAVWLLQTLVAIYGGARLIRASEGGTVLLLVAGIVGFAGWLALRRVFGWSSGQSCLSLIGWMGAYVLLWVAGILTHAISLPVYLAAWAIFGAAGGYLIATRPPAQPKARSTATARRSSAVARSSEFGRVPADTVVLLTQHVRHASGPIAGALPEGAPQPMRDFTVRAVLDRTVRDWWENGNTEGLGTKDIADLRSFVTLAAAIASPPEHGGIPLQGAEAQAIYRATLAALLDDWLANWNADGVDGPPRR